MKTSRRIRAVGLESENRARSAVGRCADAVREDDAVCDVVEHGVELSLGALAQGAFRDRGEPGEALQELDRVVALLHRQRPVVAGVEHRRIARGRERHCDDCRDCGKELGAAAGRRPDERRPGAQPIADRLIGLDRRPEMLARIAGGRHDRADGKCLVPLRDAHPIAGEEGQSDVGEHLKGLTQGRGVVHRDCGVDELIRVGGGSMNSHWLPQVATNSPCELLALDRETGIPTAVTRLYPYLGIIRG